LWHKARLIGIGKKTPLFQQANSLTHALEFRSDNGHKVLAVSEDTFTATIVGASYTHFKAALTKLLKM